MKTSQRFLKGTRGSAGTYLSASHLGKRTFDLVASLAGLIVLWPVLLFLALLIRLDSKGPIFFRQERLGQDATPFQIWKFRTMVIDAEARLAALEVHNESSDGVLFKMKKDPRVTRIGHFLRKTSLDELPQLLNVLLGQMSLVGPRPLQLRDCRKAQEHDSSLFVQRLAVPPGITGVWQVSGRSDISFGEMLRLDLDYIDNWSFQVDLRILWRTLIVVFKRKGAY
jgi:exopolysaccharide biosynthesis polyprenyl glycosylphosphotransferase